MELLQRLADAVVDGDVELVDTLVDQALGDGLSAQQVLQHGLLRGMGEVDRLFADGEFFLPEVMLASETMRSATRRIVPLLSDPGIRHAGVVVIGTVQGDMHDIGKNLVASMLEAAGFMVHDLGVDVSVNAFLRAAEEHDASVIALSALLTTTMPTSI